jgi:hypothetical protein
MNRSSTSPRSFSTDQLRAALGDVGGPARPDYLPDIVEQASRLRQRPTWTLLETWFSMDITGRRQGVPRAAVLFGVLAALVALLAAGAVYIGAQQTQPERPLGLPTTPDAWERVVIDTPSGAGAVVSLAASPHGLLAVVSADDDSPAWLFASTDGHDWTRVPADRHPPLRRCSPNCLLEEGGGRASVVGTDRGFLIVGSGVWVSENGFDWHALAVPSEDPDLRAGTMLAAALGGPGYVAVGSDNKAWFSTDGSDWTLAQVPPPPTQDFKSRGFAAPTVNMHGVVEAGEALVAWGSASLHTEDRGMHVPVMWTSDDGQTWVNVLDPRDAELLTVAAGPDGFVAIGEEWDAASGVRVVVRVSADGQSWERVDILGPAWTRDADGTAVGLGVSSIAASKAGYVAVGELAQVCLLTCDPGEVVIWTSADGRSWSRLPNDGRFARAYPSGVVAWGSRFVGSGGLYGQPAIWISDPTAP